LTRPAPEISFIIPVHDEAGSVGVLVERISEEMRSLGRSHEIIVVDDGSRDGTDAVLEEAFRRTQELITLRLRRNFGKAAALQLGFRRSRGDLIFTLDGDLQDDPMEIPRFLEKIAEGNDLVSGWKATRHDPLSKRLPSKVFNAVVGIVSGLRLHDFNCGYKCYRREVLGSIRIYGELHRFIPALAHAKGFRVAEISVRHHPRLHGRSKYGWKRIPRGFLDFLSVIMITRYPRTALHAFGTFGALLLLSSIVLAMVLLLCAALDQDLGDTRILVWLVALLAVAGGQALLFGVLADFLSRSFATEPDDLVSTNPYRAEGRE